jgi:hypothetical protein
MTMADDSNRYSTAKLLADDYEAISKLADSHNAYNTEAFSALRVMAEKSPRQFLLALREVREGGAKKS